MFDYIIVGAGFSGCVIAERIANILDKKVLIVDKRSHVGGNCYDYKDNNGIIVHKYGPHLFHTDNDDTFNYLSKFTSWVDYSHKVVAYIDGKKVPIPFNLNTISQLFPKDVYKTFEKKLIDEFGYNKKIPIFTLMESDDQDLKFLANYVYENVYVNYTAKQWGLDPKDLDPSVMSRVPIFIGLDDRYFHDKYQSLPKDGYTPMFTNMLKNKNIKIMLDTDYTEIMQIRKDKIKLFGNDFSGKVVYTGPVDELFDDRYGDLSYRSLKLVFEDVDHEYFQDKTTVNYPNNYSFTRITEFKHMYQTRSKKSTILKEYPQEYVKGENIPYYPVFTKDQHKKYEKYKTLSKTYKNLILVGRLAEYKYYDMDDVVERALEVFKEELSSEL
ncbi:UDP-galactopyranose mutase [bacterium]|jgi:UDP-galactopyranose mutase|nr:UDP-galactopyranose mutase [bacterium]